MKRILILFSLHAITFGMEEQEQQNAAPLAIPKANPALMRAITESNHAAFLSAMRNNQDQNYLWKASDGNQHKAYVDLTAAMYALKILRTKNRWECALNVTTAVTWDLGNMLMKYAINSYAVQYPALHYVDPISQSHTSTLLLGYQPQEIPVVHLYKPAKCIARDLLIHKDTNLTLERAAKNNGKPVTVETYLNSMLASWNPVTRKDGRDLSYELGQVLREREGIDQNDEEFRVREGHGISVMGFQNSTNRFARRGILLFSHNSINDLS